MTNDTSNDEHRFPCDQCGADFRFDPAAGVLTCDFCGNTAEMHIPKRMQAIHELDFRTAVQARLPETELEEYRVSKCPNCAAEVEFKGADHSTDCPFCATPVVTDTGTNRHIKPKAVLPFAFDENTARDAMSDWLGRLWFAPNGLQKYARKGRKMDGIYVPYWTFDADTKTGYRGERGTVYYEERVVVRDGKRERQRVQKIRWRAATGRVARFFDDVLVLASRSLPKSFTDALEPWDLSALETYRPDFLAGFRAEGYTIELTEGFNEARVRMDRQIERDVKFDIGGDRQRIHALDTKVSDVTFKHILLPVWVAAYKYRGKTYRFVINGQTGRVQGERPYSAWKIALAVLAVAIAGAALAFAYAQTQ